MLRDYEPARYETDVERSLVFDDGRGNGFWFPCDENGSVSDIPPEAAKNLEWCMSNPEKFARFNKVVEWESRYKVPASGYCVCGNKISLWDQYYGACECEKCGRWYNMFGQELNPPDRWGMERLEEVY